MAQKKKPLVFTNGDIEEATENEIIETSVGLPNTTIGDKKTDIGTAWTQLTVTSHNIVTPVIIQADPSNTGFIEIGVKNDPPNEPGDPTIIIAKLDAGMAMQFPTVNDPSKLFHDGSVATDDLYWTAGKEV